ncbi:ABC transporter ATP-binding protein [Variovorax ginsengisoli]|uniref:Branched-chain amino acid transport system ATP-binding protein n=1 Tax=Variovorax ginsengisoli TaxID=363844 RepID=A0ABT9S8P0_9BURK|nr:ABC transporter ATP-binding protein [Variovorax ginsengisoli]MDP9899737.1 branched-chain amino acid transport system ATP-binding protein [Variovorax ginsengisoli]
MNPVLKASGICKAYRGVVALDGVSIELPAGSITGLIGPNGSGKSTLFDCICGFQARDAGSVMLDGQDLAGLPPQRIARMGLRRTFQQLRVFPELTLRQNLLTAAQAAPGFSYLSELLRTPAVRAHERQMMERADAMLEEIQLTRLAGALAGSLSYGQKKLLELGMALMNEPKLLLLDEPMAGVNPTLVEGLKEALLQVNRRGIALLIVEHNLKLMFEIAQRIYVLEQGRLLVQGTPEEVARDERVIEAYLGRRDPVTGEQGAPLD